MTPSPARRAGFCLGLMLVAVAGLLVIRRPFAALHPQFFAEDGTVFWRENYLHGWHAFLHPYNGYLHFGPRLVAWLAGWCDPAAAPALFYLGALIAHLLVIAALFSPRIDLPFKPALALGTVLVPHTSEVFTNATNIQWPLALGLVLLSLARDPETFAQLGLDGTATLFIGLTGPFSILFLPLFAARAWIRRSRASWILLGACGCAGVIQARELLATGIPIGGHQPCAALLVSALAFRLWGTFFAGYSVPAATASPFWIVIGVAATGAFLALACRPGPWRRARISVGAAWVALSAAVAAKFVHDPGIIAPATNGDRYFYLPHVLVLWWLILEFAAAPARRRWLPAATAAAAVVAGLGQFVEPARPIMPWSSLLQPVRAGEPFSIPTLPRGLNIVSSGRPKARR